MKQRKQFAILDRIKVATTAEEISGLLFIGNKLDASDRTRRRWFVAAEKRKLALEKP